MRKAIYILTNIALCISAAFIMAGCMEKEGPLADYRSVMIELKVSSDEMTKSSPTSTENEIETVRIYAFYAGRLAGHTYADNVTSDGSVLLDLTLPETGIHEVEFYVIANEKQMSYEAGLVDLTPDMTKQQLEAVRFTGLQSSSSLPMYCKRKESINVDNLRGVFFLSQTITFSLERSLAKISMYAAKVSGGAGTPQILSASILADGTRQYSYLFPQTTQILNEISSRINDRALKFSTMPVNKEIEKGSADVKNPLKYDLVVADTYLPEVTYGSESWTVSSAGRGVVLKVEYATTEGGELKTEFVNMPPIQRNHHYKVCILIDSEGQVSINYVVADWEDYNINVSFDYPTHTYIQESIISGGTEPEKPSGPAKMSESKPFEGFFKMSYPANDSWTPTLVGDNASHCTINVYDGNNEVEWPVDASDKWYRITVTPRASMIVGDEVKLAITYMATGLETIEYMLINGEAGNLYWPYEGTSEQDAEYIIITKVN